MASPGKCCDSDGPAGGACPCTDPVADAGTVPAERNRYFTGKYLTARDLTAEQRYFVSRHRLHQRALHGWGIVVGLDVVRHPDPECAKAGWVVVTPGIAVDGYGREVVVRQPVPVRLPAVFPIDVPCGREGGDVPKAPPLPNTTRLLVVRYAESCVEPVPVFADADGCTPRKASNRVSEGVCFRLAGYDENSPACWGTPPPPKCPCPPAGPAAIPESLEAILADSHPADCDGAVPLALVTFGDTTERFALEMDGRRYLPGPLNPRQLTHVCDVSWNHDAPTPAANLWRDHWHAHNRDGIRLTVTFDRPLHERMTEAVKNAGRRFFTVRFVNADGILQSAAKKVAVSLSDCRTRLHYDIEKCHLHDAMYSPRVVYVALNCDFLTDRWGRAVDGDHLHGSLGHRDGRAKGPSGNGVEGGTFESWFRLSEGEEKK